MRSEDMAIEPRPESPMDELPAPTAGDTSAGDATTEVASDRSRVLARAAFWVFVAYEAIAFILLETRFGAGYWFSGDDWGMLAGRSLGDAGSWFQPQHNHWSTVPFLTYQILFQFFGLESYRPYMTVTILLHLTLALLLRTVMRRSGVGPWVATLVAGVFVLMGTGFQNMLLAIQVSMVGSMVFGVTHLLLADHDGPFDRRDALGLAAGAVALAASGVGIPMVMLVGLAVLIRRGWRMAFLHTVPLAALYGGWYLWQRSHIVADPAGGVSIAGYWRWLREAGTGVFLALGQYPLVAIGLGVMLIVGLLLAWLPLDWLDFRRRAAMPVALLAGGVALQLLVASQRYAIGLPRSSRYMAMGAAMVLPALGVAAAALIRRWKVAIPVVVALFLIGVPGNLRVFDTSTKGVFGTGFFRTQRQFVAGAARSPVATKVPRDVRPDPNPYTASDLTVGFLLDALADGRAPHTSDLPPATQEQIATRLSLSQSPPGTPIPSGTECAQYTEPLVITPNQGDEFAFTSRVAIAPGRPDGSFGAATVYDPYVVGSVLTAQLPNMVLRVGPVAPATSFSWCTVPPTG